ncbi:MAG: DUF7455 domain-containing protein [bacterium]
MALNRHNDRCDRCGSQAWVEVVSPKSGFNLLFCAHHFARVELAMVAAGWTVGADERGLINAAPSPSASVD